MTELRVKIPYSPRPYQAEFEAAMDQGRRRACLVWARQHGKDFACWNFMIWQAIQKVGTYFYIFPEYSHGKRVIWNGITMEGTHYIDQLPYKLIRSKSSSDMRIEMVNGSCIQIVGSANYNALRGSPLKGAVLSEYAYQSPNVWDLVLDPVFSNANNEDAWVIFNSTPQGKNHFYDLFTYAQNNPQTWYSSLINNDITHLVSDEAIAQKRLRGMSEETIQQEYYCFTGDNEVLTAVGNKKIGDVSIGEVVLTHSGRWRAVLNKFEREYEGELIKIWTHGSYEPIECTASHPLRVLNKTDKTYEWKAAGKITCGDVLVYPKLQLLQNQLVDYDLAEIIG